MLKFHLILLITVSFSQCSSTKMLQNDLPFEIGETYYQESNSVVNIFISMTSNSKNILLDSVYFQGKQTKLEYENNLFVGRFKKSTIKKPDIIMSNEPYAEYGNKALKLPKKTPFELKNNECIISYKEGAITKYFKIDSVIKKENTN